MKKSPTNMSTMSYKQLLGLRDQVSNLIEERRNEERAALKEKLTKMATDAGFRLEAILENRAKLGKRTFGSVPVKYRDPSNAENTWSGRGHPARWLQAYLKDGKKLESFKVDA